MGTFGGVLKSLCLSFLLGSGFVGSVRNFCKTHNCSTHVTGYFRHVNDDTWDGYKATTCSPTMFPPHYWVGRYKSLESGAKIKPKAGYQMYGSVPAQHKIYAHQHPTSCQGKQFLIVEGLYDRGHGIGSTLHVQGVILAKAMELNRILLFLAQNTQPNATWIEGSFCRGAHHLYDCYFEPESSCTLRDALDENGWEDIPYMVLGASQMHIKTLKFWMGPHGVMENHQFVPSMFLALLAGSHIPQKWWYYWWRAQSMAFLVRPNGRVLAELEVRRLLSLKGGGVIPEGTISAHIRHADKGSEMILKDSESYVRAAEGLWKNHTGLTRTLFVSTEDQGALHDVLAHKEWKTLYVDVVRDNANSEDRARAIGWNEEFLNSLLNLDLAMECDGWVGTIFSNWNRLIDELRSVVRCKAHKPFFDLEQGYNIQDFAW